MLVLLLAGAQAHAQQQSAEKEAPAPFVPHSDKALFKIELAARSENDVGGVESDRRYWEPRLRTEFGFAATPKLRFQADFEVWLRATVEGADTGLVTQLARVRTSYQLGEHSDITLGVGEISTSMRQLYFDTTDIGALAGYAFPKAGGVWYGMKRPRAFGAELALKAGNFVLGTNVQPSASIAVIEPYDKAVIGVRMEYRPEKNGLQLGGALDRIENGDVQLLIEAMAKTDWGWKVPTRIGINFVSDYRKNQPPYGTEWWSMAQSYSAIFDVKLVTGSVAFIPKGEVSWLNVPRSNLGLPTSGATFSGGLRVQDEKSKAAPFVRAEITASSHGDTALYGAAGGVLSFLEPAPPPAKASASPPATTVPALPPSPPPPDKKPVETKRAEPKPVETPAPAAEAPTSPEPAKEPVKECKGVKLKGKEVIHLYGHSCPGHDGEQIIATKPGESVLAKACNEGLVTSIVFPNGDSVTCKQVFEKLGEQK
jgi:hypothetical protein